MSGRLEGGHASEDDLPTLEEVQAIYAKVRENARVEEAAIVAAWLARPPFERISEWCRLRGYADYVARDVLLLVEIAKAAQDVDQQVGRRNGYEHPSLERLAAALARLEADTSEEEG